jgi:pimeloyl-ACP methyl ester carboxylesterase
MPQTLSALSTAVNGSPRLTFIGFDLSRNPAARDALASIATASGGRMGSADDPATLAALLTSGATGSQFGGASFGGPPQRSDSLLPYGIALGVLNLLLLAALVLTKTRAGRRLLRGGSSWWRHVGVVAIVALSAFGFVVPPTEVMQNASVPASTTASAASAPLFANDPVLLVHGIFGSAASFEGLSRSLQYRGWTELPVLRYVAGSSEPECVQTAPTANVAIPPARVDCIVWRDAAFAAQTGAKGARIFARVEFADNGGLTFEEQGELVRYATAAVRTLTGSARVRLVGHSMGGLASRAYLQGRDYANDVSQLITVATPHAGSLLPYIVRVLAGANREAPIEFASELVSTSFKDKDANQIELDIPAAISNVNGLRRLIGTPPAIPVLGLFPTLYSPGQRRESFKRAIRELVMMPRVGGIGTLAARRLKGGAATAGVANAELKDALKLVEIGSKVINKRYISGASVSGRDHNALASIGRKLNAARVSKGFANMSAALAGLSLATTLTDEVAGALLLHALATDEAEARVRELQATMKQVSATTGYRDEALTMAIDDAWNELDAAQSAMGALAVEVNNSLPELARSTVAFGVTLLSIAKRVSGMSAFWVTATLAIYDTARAVSDQWEMAQDASTIATIVRQARIAGRSLDPIIELYGQLAFYETMSTALSTSQAKFADALKPGSINKDLAKDFAEESLRVRGALARLGVIQYGAYSGGSGAASSPCLPAGTVERYVTSLIPLAKFIGFDPDAPSVQRLAADSPELQALNNGSGVQGYGPLPATVQYHSLMDEAPLPMAAATSPRCITDAFALWLNDISASANSMYVSNSSTLGMSAELFSKHSDWVVPLPSQSLKMVRVGWAVPSEMQLVRANHLSVPSARELLDLIDVPTASVTVAGANRVLLVVDLSGSMGSGGKLDAAKSALNNAVANVANGTSISLMGFGRSCESWTIAPFTTDKSAIVAQVGTLRADGSTPLLGAMEAAASAVRASPDPEQMSVVVMTDGGESCNTARKDPIAVARELGMALHIVSGTGGLVR